MLNADRGDAQARIRRAVAESTPSGAPSATSPALDHRTAQTPARWRAAQPGAALRRNPACADQSEY
jgi:hypothetical protein